MLQQVAALTAATAACTALTATPGWKGQHTAGRDPHARLVAQILAIIPRGYTSSNLSQNEHVLEPVEIGLALLGVAAECRCVVQGLRRARIHVRAAAMGRDGVQCGRRTQCDQRGLIMQLMASNTMKRFGHTNKSTNAPH